MERGRLHFWLIRGIKWARNLDSSPVAKWHESFQVRRRIIKFVKKTTHLKILTDDDLQSAVGPTVCPSEHSLLSVGWGLF